MSSCFLFQEKQSSDIYVITAGHGVPPTGTYIETSERNEEGQPLLINAGTFNIFYNQVDIDFAFSRLPIKNIQQQLPEGNNVPIFPYQNEFTCAKKDEPYGFAVMNNYEFIKNGDTLLLHRYLCREMFMELEKQEEHINYFKLARKKSDDEYYKGASGSPIVDQEGAITSILIGAQGEYLKSFRLDNVNLLSLMHQRIPKPI